MNDVRIVELTYDQVAENWDLIYFSIYNSLPPFGKDKASGTVLLENILTGKLSCWTIFKVEEDRKDLLGIFTTAIVYDFSGAKNCLIYSAYGVEGISSEIYDQCFGVIYKYAKSKECDGVISYTSNPVLIKKVKELSGNVDYVVVNFQI